MKKKLLSLFVALAMCITLAAGCVNNTNNNTNNNNNNNNNDNNNDNTDNNNSDPVQLTAPTITLTDNVISWSAVDNAAGYNVYEGETAVSTAQTQLKYTIEKTETGSWTYTVVAVSGDTTKYTNSNASKSVTYTYTKPEEKPEDKPSVDTSTKLTGNIYVVGDSTVSSFSDTRYMPRYGYGTQLYNYINCDATQIKNLALSGRSSYSFTKEGNYQTLKSNISEGDYLIIGFGHNDQKDAIYTNPNLPSSDDSLLAGTADADKHYASFKYTLKTFYIDLAKNAKATPIICTPIVRAEASNNYSGKSGHVTATSDGGAYAGGDYPNAIRELAAECEITCIDLTAITKADYTTIGFAEASKYHSHSTAKYDTDGTTVIPTDIDKTHTNLYGAKMNSYYIASELLKTQNTLAAHVKTNIKKPVYEEEKDACVYSGYKVPAAGESTYKSFNPTTDKSAKWSITADGWYGTAFGLVSVSKAQITQNSNNSFTIGTTGDGKITSGGDGIAAVFMQLEAEKNFKIEADVTINNYGTDNQTGFGIMLRDDIYIDQKLETLKSNYVAAGCYGLASSANMNFYRDKGTLTSSGNTGALDTSSATVHKLSLERTGTTIIAKIDGYTYTSEADFELKAVDGQYMYLCLFATRVTNVTFSNIVFTDNGTSVA